MTNQAETFLRNDRLSWQSAPAAVRAWVAERAGEPIAGWQDRSGGMSTGLAVVVHGSRRSVFVKGLDATVNPHGGEMYRREAAFAAQLPDHPAVPAPVDHGEVLADDHQWLLIMYPAVSGGTPEHPWRSDQLTRVLDAWLPVQLALHGVDWPARGANAEMFDGWRTIAADPTDPWHPEAERYLEREQRFVAALRTPPLIGAHLDLRADNILLDDDRVWFVDWAHPDVAPSWCDPWLLTCDVIGSGGDRPDGGDIDVPGVWARHPVFAGSDPAVLVDGVIAFAGFLHAASRQPPIPGVPRGRAWQALFAERMLPFVRRHN